MGKGSSSPPVPDPAVAIQAQAEANRINQVTPFGQIFFGKFTNPPSVGGPSAVPAASAAQQPQRRAVQPVQPEFAGAGDFFEDVIPAAPSAAVSQPGAIPGLPENFSPITQDTQVTQFSPEVQALLDTQLGAATGLGEEAKRRVALLPGAFTPTDFSADRRRVEDAIFTRAQGLLDPVFELGEERLRERLANAGQLGNQFINEGGRQDLDIFASNRNKTFSDLALDAIIRGGAEQSRLAGETRLDRAVPFNELAALMGGSQINVPLPNSQITPLDVTGPFALQQSALNQGAANDAAAQQGLMSGLFGLGSAAIGSTAGSAALTALFGGI